MAVLGGPLRLRAGLGWPIGLAGLCLVGVLLVSSPAAASHPPETLGVAHDEGDFAAADPALDGSAPPASPRAAALICLAVLALPGILAARQWRRTAAVATLGLFLWFSAEAAFHSAHHLTDPGEAERCPVFAAAQHLPGADPAPDVPVLERPAPSAAAPLPALAVASCVVLDGKQARAPPARPA
jgi:hypothetical protein